MRDRVNRRRPTGHSIVVIESFEVFLELEGRIELDYQTRNQYMLRAHHANKNLTSSQFTCDNGISGSPDAISAALVPGRILLVDPSSVSAKGAKSWSPLPVSPTVGDCGPIWTSVNGGGLGRRGELEGDEAVAVAAIFLETDVVAGAFCKEIDDRFAGGANGGIVE